MSKGRGHGGSPRGACSACGASRSASTIRALSLALLASLAACGGGDNSSSGGGNKPPVTPGPGPVLGAPDPAAVTCGASVLTGLQSHVYVAPPTDGTAEAADCGGSAATACQTLPKAVAQCEGSGTSCAVLAHWGSYTLTAPLELSSTVSLYGSCQFGEEATAPYRTIVYGAPGAEAIRVMGSLTTPQTMENLLVIAGAASGTGGSSIAMSALNANLSVKAARLVARPGANGSDGAAAGSAGGNGTSGSPGPAGNSAGGAACNASAGAGGAGGAWADVNSDCTDFPGAVGGAAGAAQGGTAGYGGTAGIWCPLRNVDWPGDAGGGGTGDRGACAAAALAAAALDGTLNTDGSWTASVGGNGRAGGGGGGGGGGGRGGSCGPHLGADGYPGAPGGGGGGGGCGGSGGQGGQQGGASIALTLVNTQLHLDSSLLLSTAGGAGGRGGDGAPGGVGGSGGDGGGGNFVTWWGHLCPGNGGGGGAGGAGGGGSAGAAGHGGPSIAIAHRNYSNVMAAANVRFSPGAGGAAGADGRPGSGGLWTQVATEGGSFTVSEPSWVRYGADTRWAARWITGSGTCDVTQFGGDPARGTPKTCEVASGWTTAATEGQTIDVSGGPLQVRFGKEPRWNYRTITGSTGCSNDALGPDPAPGIVKQCDIRACSASAAAEASAGTSATQLSY